MAAIAATALANSAVNPPASGLSSSPGIASNFTAFLRLLTTQLQNQNPLEPLDTNQFTQQLVQFAQVEQQLRSNEQLETLVAIQKSTQSSAALDFVGKTVLISGATTHLGAEGTTVWTFSSPKPASAIVTIRDSTGQTAFSSNYSINSGRQDFVWDGRGTNGQRWPAGNYTMTITAKDASGQNVAIVTDVQGIVDSADVTKTPPVLTIGELSFTIDQIKRVVLTVPEPTQPGQP
ncbi:MAG TPA: flagellar hook capping FlgD N-terminal domain-containing protein [Xanthobacteraceae bacterium]|nr:flagellar hook capping FlgD N-terminal domain-containing protein [Xanthobacteraceae bacterium]